MIAYVVTITSVSFVKLSLTFFVFGFFKDTDMLYEPTNTPAMARTSNLNEELGQVSQPDETIYWDPS